MKNNCDFFRHPFRLLCTFVISITIIIIILTADSNDNYNFMLRQMRYRAVKKDNRCLNELYNKTIAEKLHKEIRVLCWVMTQPKNHKKAMSIKRTWGKRCNKLLFMSTKADEELDPVVLPVKEGRGHLWGKVKAAFIYVHKHYYDEYDWFFKTDDDTYAIMENMRYMLYNYSKEMPIYFGYKFKKFVSQGYMSGGSGYVLSKEALRRFVLEAIPNRTICEIRNNLENEDVFLGTCLQNVKVIAGDSRDYNKRHTFLPLPPFQHLRGNIYLDKDNWYWKYMFYPNEEGLNCCSENAVSFHYIKPEEMYEIDYLIYHLKIYGITNLPVPLPKKITKVKNEKLTTSELKSNQTKN